MLCFTGNISAGTLFSQLPTYDVRFENRPMISILRELETMTGYSFTYRLGMVNESDPVSLNIDDAPLNKILDIVLKDNGYTYEIEGNVIFISAGKERNVQPRTQQNQMTTVRGTVVDEDGSPVVGAVIVLKDDVNIYTSTDVGGNFSLRVTSSSNPVLIVSFIGKKTVETTYTGYPLQVVLKEDKIQIGNVVVTGIFDRPRESYTGAAVMITSEELKHAGNRSLLTSIRNIDPSFNIADNIDIGSDPNRLPTITIRGNSSLPAGIKDVQTAAENTRIQNQPLIILDGFEVPLWRLMDMDESKVASITLLKDASATAMYGARGSNGVVVITTKVPDKGRLNLTYKGGINIEAPDLASYNLMNAREKLTFEMASGLYESPSAIKEEALRELYIMRNMDVERGVDTYWLKYPVRAGIGSRHSIGIEGGEDIFRYGVNLSYNNIAGAMKGSNRNTFNGSVLFVYRTKNLTFKNDLQVSLNKAVNSPYGSFGDYGRLNSYWTPYKEDGSVQKVLENYHYSNIVAPPSRVLNPLYNAGLPSRNTENYLQVLDNFSIEWNITTDLFVRGQLGVSTQRNRSDYYLCADHTRFDDYSDESFDRKGMYVYGTGNSNRYEGQMTVNYTKSLGEKHQLFAGLGLTVSEEAIESYSITGEGISLLNMDFLGMARKYPLSGGPAGGESVVRAVGPLFNLNYIYDNRYFVDLSGKYEGSSQFGTDRRMAPFWSAGIGWNLHDEKFFRIDRTINLARLRMSYGVTGSQSFAPYLANTSYTDAGSSYQAGYAVHIMTIGNRELRWQKTYQYNIGTELGFFDNRLSLTADVYHKLTQGLLTDISLPPASGFKTYTANLGEVENKGFEISTNVFILRNNSGFTWSVGGTMAHNVNTIKKISESLKAMNDQLRLDSNPSFLFEEGQSINTIYAVRSKGIDPSNGAEIFVKADGSETYTWDARDKMPCGKVDPKITGNINTILRYNGFNLSAYFHYRYGGQAYNHALAEKVENIFPYNNADRRALYERWKTPGERARFKSVRDVSTTYATTRFVADDNTFAFQTLSLGYDFPAAWTKKHLALEYLSVKGYMEDIVYLSTIKRERGLDYPFSRKFSISLTARF